MRIFLVGFIASVLVASCAQSSAQAKPASSSAIAPASQAVLADGTPVKLRSASATSLAALNVGDSVELNVVQDVVIHDTVVISTNSVATAVVTSRHSRISKGDNNKVDVNLRSVALVDGERVALRPNPQGKAGYPTEAIVSSGIGQDIALGDGEEFTAYVIGNVALDLTKMRLSTNPTQEVRISSSPANAEISIDGRVVGTSPYIAHLTRGEHAVSLRIAGYQPWRSTVRIADANAEIQAQLSRTDSTEQVVAPKVAAPSLGDLARQARAKRAAQEGQKPSGSTQEQGTKPAPTTLEN